MKGYYINRGWNGRAPAPPIGELSSERPSPVAWTRKVLDLQPDPFQQQILEHTGSRILVCAGRQCGKSTVAAARVLYEAVHFPGCDILLAAPVGRQSVDGKAVSAHSYGKGQIIWGLTLRDVLLKRKIEPDFGYDGEAPLDFIHRSMPEAEIYFIRNAGEQPFRVNARFRVTGRQPEIWDPATGAIRTYPAFRFEAGSTAVPLDFAVQESLVVVFWKPASQPGVVSVRHTGASAPIDWKSGVAFEGGRYELDLSDGTHKTMELESIPKPRPVTGEWTVHFQENRGAPDSVQFPELISWTDSKDPGIRYFSGIAEYTKTVELGDAWTGPGRHVNLDLGTLWAAADVTVNGQPVGPVWKAPYRIDITKAVHSGSNDLKIRVANDWANRLIGDALDPKGKQYTKTNIVRTSPEGTPWEKAPLIPSGLLGPVILLPAIEFR